MDGHQIKGELKFKVKTTPSALAWGWTVWGCVQKFYPSFISFLKLPLFLKNLTRLPLKGNSTINLFL